MSKYIDAEKLIAEIDSILSECTKQTHTGVYNTCHRIKSIIASLQQEQTNNMIQWTGNNLKEVIDFTGKSPRFGEWFKSWEEYENYVHTHNDILKLFCEDGSHFEVPVGAWIVKTPDGYNVPSVARFIHAKQEQSADGDDGKFVKILVRKEFAEQFQKLGDELQASQSSFIRAMNQQEQQEVDLDDIIRVEFGTRAKVEGGKRYVKLDWDKFGILAYHFYALGQQSRIARKEI